MTATEMCDGVGIVGTGTVSPHEKQPSVASGSWWAEGVWTVPHPGRRRKAMRSSMLLAAVGLICVPTLSSVPAHAQATRTWGSGVGDDANPCSRTAPCKTFPGAISKTAAGGEINVLDPGGFGAVTITKAISIINEGVGEAGVLVSGTNGIIISAGVGDTIQLRGLFIDGIGTGLNGIRFLAGRSLYVTNCVIQQFTQFGIDFEPANLSALHTKPFLP